MSDVWYIIICLMAFSVGIAFHRAFIPKLTAQCRATGCSELTELKTEIQGWTFNDNCKGLKGKIVKLTNLVKGLSDSIRNTRLVCSNPEPAAEPYFQEESQPLVIDSETLEFLE